METKFFGTHAGDQIAVGQLIAALETLDLTPGFTVDALIQALAAVPNEATPIIDLAPTTPDGERENCPEFYAEVEAEGY